MLKEIYHVIKNEVVLNNDIKIIENKKYNDSNMMIDNILKK